jgi:Cd2+/Zn2+-exporting ATPase
MSRATIAVVNHGENIPFDGKILEGFAIVDESAQTGVSTPARLEAPADVIAGTVLVEGWLKIEGRP